jgi:peptide-methionine (S)-S-oxide reductase
MKLLHLIALVPPLLGVQCLSSNNTTQSSSTMSDSTATIEAGTASTTSSGKTETASLGGGCFWCVEAVYQDLQGVLKVESGYMGGAVDNPSYREICTGLTGHAEIIQVTFDPAQITYAEILDVFFHVHDPTTLNRQGNDVGTQYRSVIFYHSNEQKILAEEQKILAKNIWSDPIVTEIAQVEKFYKAEDYHQNYYKDNPNQGYCSFVIAPKVKKFREQYKARLKQ